MKVVNKAERDAALMFLFAILVVLIMMQSVKYFIFMMGVLVGIFLGKIRWFWK